MAEMIRKTPRKRNTTSSSSSAKTAPSKLPTEVLELGQYLVRELNLQDGVDTLGRWMAHHLAELLVRAKSAKGVEKEVAEDRVSQLILGLWAQRHGGHRYLDPMAKYAKAAEVLATIHPSNGRFAILDHPGVRGRASLTLQVFDTAAKLALFEIVELIQDLPTEIANPVAEFLSKEENNYLEVVRKARDQIAVLADVRSEKNEGLHDGHPDLQQHRRTLFERLQSEMATLSTSYPPERGRPSETDGSAPPNDDSVTKPARVRSSKKAVRKKASE